jgi:hypothetical protein
MGRPSAEASKTVSSVNVAIVSRLQSFWSTKKAFFGEIDAVVAAGHFPKHIGEVNALVDVFSDGRNYYAAEEPLRPVFQLAETEERYTGGHTGPFHSHRGARNRVHIVRKTGLVVDAAVVYVFVDTVFEVDARLVECGISGTGCQHKYQNQKQKT